MNGCRFWRTLVADGRLSYGGVLEETERESEGGLWDLQCRDTAVAGAIAEGMRVP